MFPCLARLGLAVDEVVGVVVYLILFDVGGTKLFFYINEEAFQVFFLIPLHKQIMNLNQQEIEHEEEYYYLE